MIPANVQANAMPLGQHHQATAWTHNHVNRYDTCAVEAGQLERARTASGQAVFWSHLSGTPRQRCRNQQGASLTGSGSAGCCRCASPGAPPACCALSAEPWLCLGQCSPCPAIRPCMNAQQILFMSTTTLACKLNSQCLQSLMLSIDSLRDTMHVHQCRVTHAHVAGDGLASCTF